VCALGFGCTQDVCVELEGQTSGTLAGALTLAETSTGRVGNGCEADNIGVRQAVNRFAVRNATNQAATITASTSGNNDTVAAVYIPEFSPADPVSSCRTSNDDTAQGNLNSRIEFSLPAGGTAEIAVWSFDQSATFNYTLEYTSSQPVVVERR
jgi:hypothetical protein